MTPGNTQGDLTSLGSSFELRLQSPDVEHDRSRSSLS